MVKATQLEGSGQRPQYPEFQIKGTLLQTVAGKTKATFVVW